MVQQATPGTEEATPADQTTTLSEMAEEVPFIEQEPETLLEGEQSLITEGQESEETEGAATSQAEGAAEGQQDTEQSEPGTEEPKMVPIEELNKVRSGLDKRIDEISKQREQDQQAIAEERRLRAEAQQRLNEQSLMVQEAQLQAQRAEHWRNQGHTDEVARQMGALEANYARKMLEFENEAKSARAEAEQFKTQATQLGSRQSAIEIAVKHGVSDEHMPLLLDVNGATDTERIAKMETLAKTLGTLGKSAKELSEVKQAEVPAGGEANQLDSGGGSTGPMTDEQFLTRYSQGLEDDHEKASAILRKRGDL